MDMLLFNSNFLPTPKGIMGVYLLYTLFSGSMFCPSVPSGLRSYQVPSS